MTLKEIGILWEEVFEIRQRCHNISSLDVKKVQNLANAFNEYKNAAVIRKVSGCQIPHICGVIQLELYNAGLLKNRYDKKLIKKSVYEF